MEPDLPTSRLCAVLALLVFAAVLARPAPAVADDPPPEKEDTVAPADAGADEGLSPVVDEGGGALRIDIVGPRPIIGLDPQEALKAVPGSGIRLDTKQLRKIRAATTLQETLRGQPGVHIRDEVGAGVVPNIGFRGLSPDRSESMLLLEDGVPAGFAPYTVNAAYYVPPSERLAAIEILKGSGQILYGPHTVGAVLNMITPAIPDRTAGSLIVTGGTHHHISTYASFGTTSGPWGFLVSLLGKWGGGYRDHNDFEIFDLMFKTSYAFSDDSNVTLKFVGHHSDSQNTYLGLTTGLYASDPFQNPAARDTYDSEWYNGQLTYRTVLNPAMDLLVNFYAAGGKRDWNRQDFARNNGFAAAPGNTVQTVGNPAVDGGAIFLRQSFGSRDRDSRYWGIEPRLSGDFRVGNREHEYEIGLRLHDERYTNERNNRTSFEAMPVTRDRDVNDTHALAFFAQYRAELNDAIDVTGGVRVEYYESTRHFQVQGGAPVDIRGTSSNTEVIPGIGFTTRLAPRNTTLFGGVHRGFAPPRVAQAIDNTGMDLQLEAEKSWNYEIGVRGDPNAWLHYEVTGFYMDFENQVVPANESGGASTQDTNAGQTEHLGFEIAAVTELVEMLSGRAQAHAPKVYLDAGYTYIHTENTTAGGLFKSKDLPYAPHHLAHLGLRGELPAHGLTASVHATHTSSQFTDQANTVAPSSDGTTGRIGGRWLVDLALRWKLARTPITLFCSINNLFNVEYIASRAPRGIFAGAPRHAFFGFEMDI